MRFSFFTVGRCSGWQEVRATILAESWQLLVDFASLLKFLSLLCKLYYAIDVVVELMEFEDQVHSVSRPYFLYCGLCLPCSFDIYVCVSMGVCDRDFHTRVRETLSISTSRFDVFIQLCIKLLANRSISKYSFTISAIKHFTNPTIQNLLGSLWRILRSIFSIDFVRFFFATAVGGLLLPFDTVYQVCCW